MFGLRSWTVTWYLLIGCHIIEFIKQANQNNSKWNNAVCSLIVLLLLRMSLLLRPHNLLVPVVLVYTCKLIKLKNWNTLTMTILHYWLSLLFFFYQVNIVSCIYNINNILVTFSVLISLAYLKYKQFWSDCLFIATISVFIFRVIQTVSAH